MSIFDQSIFRAYDMRGTYPNQMNEQVAYAAGQAFVHIMGAKNVVVGRDVRGSGVSLQEAAIRGIIDAGANAIDVGIISTEMLYFAAATLECDGGITITASHNPPQWNGIKFIGAGAVALTKEEKLGEIYEHIQANHKAEKEAEIERLIADGEVKNKSAIDTLKHDIEHLQHEIDHIDDGFIANGGIKNLRHALQSRKNKIMMERIGQNMKRSQKDALEHKALAEVQSMAGLRLADNDREYQERDALMRESVDRSDMAKERRDRVDKQNYEGMSAIKYEKDAAGNDILSKPIRDERTKNIAGRTAKEINLSRMRTGLREKKLSEKYTADKLESDRIKQEARGNLLLVDENPDKDEDYQRYQEVERWLDAARDEQKAKSTTALPEAFSKPFHTSKAHSYTDHTGAVKQSSAHTRILSGPLILTEEERNSEAKMKSLIEASGHLQGMVEMMGQNKPETIRYAANRIMQLTPPDRVDQALVNMTVYGDPAAIQAMVGADAAKLQAAKDAGLIDASVTDAAGINNQTTNFDDVNYRRLRSAFGKSTVSQRIDKITGDRADIVKGTNYTKQADGSFVEKSYI